MNADMSPDGHIPRRLAWGAVVAAIALALAPLPPALVERFYATGFYPVIQPWLTAASNLVPFALFDLFVIVVIGGWLAGVGRTVAREWRQSPWRAAAHAARQSITLASILYLAFLALWGLNYRREPLTAKLQFDRARAEPERARVLAARVVDELNATSGNGTSGNGTGGPASLAAAFARVQRELGAATLARPARPKATLFDGYFRLAGVEGMIDPFFLETLVDPGLLPFERPYAVAHEWSHLAGYADEGEASFVGWLTCLHGDVADQYSGWLFLYEELAGQLSPAERRAAASRLAAGPRADLAAIAARVGRQTSPVMSAVSWRVYDRYLKANRVEAGTASYDEIVRLVLGVRFAPDWVPQRRGGGRSVTAPGSPEE